MKRITILLAAAALVLSVAAQAVLAAGGGGTRIALRATGAFPAAKGTATFKAKPGERELQAEVEHVRRLVGKRVSFFVGGKLVATKRVNGFGAAEISRNSERGEFVPRVAKGTVVSVKTAAGRLIVRGSF